MLRSNPTTLFLAAGLLCAAVVVTYGTIRLMPARTPAPAPVVEALPPDPGIAAVIAKRMIQRGEVISQADLDFIRITGPLPPTALTSADAVVGKVAVADIMPFQLVLTSLMSADPARAGIASLVPTGYRAIELRTTDEVAVGNFVHAGDHVDVELVLPDAVLPNTSDARRGSTAEGRTLLQNVVVLAVGEQLGAVPEAAANQKHEPPRGVTLALKPEQVSQLTLARSLGSLFLTLRNPSDVEDVMVDPVRLAGLRGAAAQGGEPAKRAIELITGGQTRTIYSQTPGAQP